MYEKDEHESAGSKPRSPRKSADH